MGLGKDYSIRILLLEDRASDAELIAMELKRAGIQFSAKRVETAMDFLFELREFSPDIILADYTLPQFTALHALQMLKDEALDTPFILVTGSQSEEVAVECMKQGATDYILKASLTRLPLAVVNAFEKRTIERERRKAEEALRGSEQRFRLLFNNNPLPMWVYDEETSKFLEVNSAAIAHYGYSREEFLAMTVPELQVREDIDRFLDRTRPAQLRLGDVSLSRHRCKDGRIIDVQTAFHALEFSGRAAILVVAEDVTERLRADEELRTSRERLRALTAHLEFVREEERGRIAREIHDILGQALTAIRIDLSWLQRKTSDLRNEHREPVREKTRSMVDLVDSTIQTVRRIASDLRPGILDNLGLAAAIEWQAQEFEKRTGIRSHFRTNMLEMRLEQESTTALFRILQEALTNVARHAAASAVAIQLQLENSTIVLEVQDNGRGISEREVNDPKSLGLLGMHERASLLGGEALVRGTQGKGTAVLIRVPIRRSLPREYRR